MPATVIKIFRRYRMKLSKYIIPVIVMFQVNACERGYDGKLKMLKAGLLFFTAADGVLTRRCEAGAPVQGMEITALQTALTVNKLRILTFQLWKLRLGIQLCWTGSGLYNLCHYPPSVIRHGSRMANISITTTMEYGAYGLTEQGTNAWFHTALSVFRRFRGSQDNVR